MRQRCHWSLLVLLAGTLAMLGQPAKAPEKPSGKHFAFLDNDFIFTLELVRDSVPILNFVNLGKGTFNLEAQDVRLVSGIKLYRPKLFDVETSLRNDPLRVSAMRVHPKSSFGLTLVGELKGISRIDRVTLQMGQESFTLQPLSAQAFDLLSQKVGKLNLLSPDIRDDYRVLELLPLGQRRRNPL